MTDNAWEVMIIKAKEQGRQIETDVAGGML